MGVVVQATHLELDERVAMKFLLPHAIENAEAATRFVREARAAVKIKSEHVARVTDVGRLENGAPYIVMEFLQGSDLAAVLQGGPLSIEDAVDFLLQASDAMAEAHAANIVHRDLKPSNLFMSMRSDGTPIIKVLDFGISKVNVPDTSDAGLTRTTTIMGSPFYMSPEQMRSSKDVDHRTDIWALGVILYELLTGTQPFNGETLPQLVAAILAEPPQSLRARRPEVPVELEAVVLSCLEKDRDRRYQSIGTLAQALMNFAPRRSRHTAERIIRLSGLDVPSSVSSGFSQSGSTFPTASGSTSPGATSPGNTAPGARTNTAWTDTNRASPQGRTAALVLGGVGVIAVLAGGAFFALRGNAGASSEPAASATPHAADVAVTPVPVARPPEVAPVVPPVESAAAPPEPPPSAAKSASPRPPAARPSAPRPSAASAPPSAPPPAPVHAPAPAPRKNPLSIDLK
jgi:serine/threonine-protein kinase